MSYLFLKGLEKFFIKNFFFLKKKILIIFYRNKNFFFLNKICDFHKKFLFSILIFNLFYLMAIIALVSMFISSAYGEGCGICFDGFEDCYRCYNDDQDCRHCPGSCEYYLKLVTQNFLKIKIKQLLFEYIDFN